MAVSSRSEVQGEARWPTWHDAEVALHLHKPVRVDLATSYTIACGCGIVRILLWHLDGPWVAPRAHSSVPVDVLLPYLVSRALLP